MNFKLNKIERFTTDDKKEAVAIHFYSFDDKRNCLSFRFFDNENEADKLALFLFHKYKCPLLFN